MILKMLLEKKLLFYANEWKKYQKLNIDEKKEIFEV
jgi:hypothetical protein